MYAVYTRDSETFDEMGAARIIALYARKAGALKRAQESADAKPGASYYVAILPEGSWPDYDSLTDRVAWFCTTIPGEDKPATSYSYSPAQTDTDDLPF
jgi:hypothetical protein